MIRRQLNWKVLAVSLGVFVVAAVCLYVLHSWQLSRLATVLLTHAQAREKDEKWHEAAVYFERYLRVHPLDIAIRGQLATMYANGASTNAERARAIEAHYRAIAAGPSESDAVKLRSKLGQLLVESGRYVEAEREAQALIDEVGDQPSAYRTLTMALFAQWKNGALAATKLDSLRLVSTAEKARHLNSSDGLLAEVTARLYREHPQVVAAEFPELGDSERRDKADACLNELVASNEHDPTAYLGRFRYRVRYELPGAANDIAKAVELAPTDFDVVLTAAKSAHREAILAKDALHSSTEVTALEERSRELYQQLLADKTLNPVPDVYLGLGDVQVALNHLDEAIAVWRTGLRLFAPPTVQIMFLARIADSLLQAGRESEARDSLNAIDKLVGSLESSVPRDERLAILQAQDIRRASWHMQRDEASMAVPLLQEVVARQVSGTSGSATAAVAWNLLGRANAQISEWGEAAAAFDRAAPLDPKSPSLRLAAAYAWLQIGRPDLAVQRVDQALAIQPSSEAMILLATGELERQRTLPAKQRSWDRAERTLLALEQNQEATAQLASPWRVEFLRADLEVFRGRQQGLEAQGRNTALSVIAEAERKYASSEEFWRLAALAYQRLDDRASADRAIERYAALTESVANQAVAKSRLAVLRNDLASAQLALEEGASKSTTGEQARLRQELIGLALAKGDVTLADRLLAIEAQQRPGDIHVLRRACELALQRGDLEAAKRWEQKLKSAGPLGTWWGSYFHAVQLFSAAKDGRDQNLREALEEVTKLSVIRPHWPMPHSLRALIEQRQGRLEEAAGSFEHAIQLGERRFSIFEQLVALLDRLNRTADAERYLSQLENQMPFSQRLTEIATNYEMRRDRPEQAIQIARAALAKRSDDANAHLWLARLLLVDKKFDEAQIEFKKALQLAPDDIRAWNGLFTFYLRSGNTEQARQTLEELSSNANLKAAERSFVLAQGYEMLGDWQRAAGQYESATEADPTRSSIHIRLAMVHLRSDPKKAEQSLRKALEVEPGSATARRMLAALLATRGDPAQFKEAEALLGQIDPASATVAIEDRRLNALLLAQYGDARQSAKAAEILEEFIANPDESTPGDRLVLAQIYESQARSSPDPSEATAKRHAARHNMLAVAGQSDAQPAHLAALIEFLLRNNQVMDAGNWLDKLELLLESKASEDPASVAQLIELRIRHGSGDRCPKLLNRLFAVDTDPIRPVAVRAKWLASQGQSTEIEALVEPVGTRIVAAAADDRERGRRARLVGDLYLVTQQLGQAERWYRTAANHDPNQFPAQVRALTLNNQLAEAIRLCRDHSQRDLTSRPAVVLATALTEVKSTREYDREVDEFMATALEQHAKDLKLHYSIATLRAVQGRYEEAIRLYRLVLKSEPKNVATLNNLAMMLAESPQNQVESLQLIDQAIDIAGQQPGLLDTKGAILLYYGKAKQALFLLEAASREAGQDARHRFHLAAAYHGVGDASRAKQQLQIAIDMNLEAQVLTPTDRRMLTVLKSELTP